MHFSWFVCCCYFLCVWFVTTLLLCLFYCVAPSIMSFQFGKFNYNYCSHGSRPTFISFIGIHSPGAGNNNNKKSICSHSFRNEWEKILFQTHNINHTDKRKKKPNINLIKNFQLFFARLSLFFGDQNFKTDFIIFHSFFCSLFWFKLLSLTFSSA